MTNPIAQTLEQHFDVAFTAPNGIKKLRELILTLAMQGKLVPQDPKDAPASELLKNIASEKARLVSEGKIKKQKPLPAISDDEKPYELPQGWAWVRLGDVSLYNGRKNVSSEQISDDTWLLDLEDIEKETSKLLCKARFQERQSKSTKSTFAKGDVLYGKLRPYLDKVIVADEDGVCTTEIVPIVPLGNLNPLFLRLLLKRPSFLQYVNELMYGVKMPRLGTEQAENSIHPLPPLAEQHRIVAKIDQLMARCDALEALQQAKEAQRLSVHQAAIRQLLDAEHTHTAWQFLQTHFAELYSVKANVSELRKAILQLAVMGKLVPQDPNDTPASELLKDIANEKARLVSEGKIKKQKPLPAISDDEKPYDLPQGWEWVRLGELFTIVYGKGLPTSNLISEGYDVFGANGIIGKYSQFLYETPQLLVSCRGAYSGKPNISPPFCFVTSNSLVLENTWEHLRLRFFFFAIEIADKEKIVTGSAQPQVTTTNLEPFLVPLPPLAEQQRIVVKIDQLMSLCDNLEQQIDASQAKQSQLLAAVMSGV